MLDLILYAGDILSEVTINDTSLTETKQKLPEVLTERKPKLNVNKTEENVITRKGDQNWKCKFLDTKLDTESQIQRIKILAIEVLREMNNFSATKP